ncbi:Fungal specific transcription factor domain, partial [Rhizoctonia solani]
MESVSYPYPLIPTPPGDWQKSLHEMQAIRMAALHNIIIRSFNAIIYHAPNVTEADVPSFIKFCRAVADVVHEHHQTEEEVMFPYLCVARQPEEKLGKGAMDANVSQHHDFMPHFDQWNEHCKKILAKEEVYESAHFVSMLRKSTDTLSAHLVDEIPTLEASIMKAHFTDAELRELETRIAKKIQECISVWILPILFVSGDLSYNSWFPDEIPMPVIFFARYISMRVGGDMWKWGQSDRYSQLKDEFKPMYAAASG